MTAVKVSLRRKLTGLMVLASLLGLGLSALALLLVTGYFGRQSSERDLATLAKVIADHSAAALSFGDAGTANRILSAVRAKPDITLACLYAAEGDAHAAKARVFAVWPEAKRNECSAVPPSASTGFDANSIRVMQAVTADAEKLGSLIITQDLKPLWQHVFQQVGSTLVVVALAFFLTFAFALREQTAMVKPLLELASLARLVSVTSDYGLRAKVRADDEVGQLAQDFNGMLAIIESSDAEVRAARDELSAEVAQTTQANKELEQALKRLTETQVQLVQSEKLASLGALVAGIAHEINTPIGVSVTAASTLQAKALVIKRKHGEGSMKRSDLDAFVTLADESTHILLNNLQRAAELIQSFKRVAVDQSSDERRKFKLGTYIGEVLLSLGPKLKKNVDVTVDCPDSIQIDSYPGALAQILTNFVTNSILHGFDDGRRGHISLTASEAAGQVQLCYADNGKGVDAEHLPHIFDPFFTTKRGSGGSGLGMHIVYNLITQRLGGRISAASEPGAGLKLSLDLPSVAPMASLQDALPI